MSRVHVLVISFLLTVLILKSFFGLFLGQKDASSILEVVDMHLKSMNGVNLATALHRFARCRLAKEHLEGVTFSSMLARALELKISDFGSKFIQFFCPTNAPCSCLMFIF